MRQRAANHNSTIMKGHFKTFFYEIGIEEVEHSKETVEWAFGEGAAYLPEYGADVHAREILHSMIQDAITHNLEAQMDLLSRSHLSPSDKRVIKSYKERIEIYKKMAGKFKFVRSEKLDK